MTDERSPADYRTRIDRRLETVIDPPDRARIPAARATVAEYDDRWYGQLLARSHGSIPDSVDSEAVVSAAGAIELLRAYCRLRSELLVQLTDDVAHSLTRDPTSTLLAGDYLHSAAYSAIDPIDHPSIEAIYQILTDTSELIVETFASTHVRSPSLTASHCALIDGTTGALGEGAAVLGATLAGVDRAHHDHFATLGRGLGVARQIRRRLDSEPGSIRVVSTGLEEGKLREHGAQRLAEADRALSELSPFADVGRLRPFLEDLEVFER